MQNYNSIFDGMLLENETDNDKNDNKKKDKKGNIVGNILTGLLLIPAIILSIIVAIVALPTSFFINKSAKKKGEDNEQELNKYPKAKQMIVKAATKMQQLLKGNLNKKYMMYPSISSSSISVYGGNNDKKTKEKSNYDITADIAYINLDAISQDVLGHGIKQSKNYDSDYYSNKEFTKIYNFIVKQINAIKKEIKKYPNGVLVDLNIRGDLWDGSNALDDGRVSIEFCIKFKKFEDLEQTPEVTKLKEAFMYEQ